jgi:hypothetical protein
VGFRPPQEFAPHELVNRLAGGCGADAEEGSHITQHVRPLQPHQSQQLELGKGYLTAGNFPQEFLLDDLIQAGRENTGAPQEVVHQACADLIAHVGLPAGGVTERTTTAFLLAFRTPNPGL